MKLHQDLPKPEDICAKDPIHLIGQIQAYGFLLLTTPDGKICGASQNCSAWLKASKQDLMHSALATWLEPLEGAPALESLDLSADLSELPFFLGRYVRRGQVGAPIDVTVHQVDHLRFFSCEPALSRCGQHIGKNVAHALDAIQVAPDLSALCAALVEEVRSIFHYAHVMVYSFDAKWDGTVLAESKIAGVASYLGQKFPASDIPPQAREVFLKNWFRIIADVDAIPSPLDVFPENEPTFCVDMSRCFLRSPSPVHLEYLRHMKVRSSLSISLIKDGVLWGLIACHDTKPHLIGSSERLAVEQIARLASSLLPQKVLCEGAAYRARIFEVCEKLRTQLSHNDQFSEALKNASPSLVDLLGGRGTSVATYFDGVWWTDGHVPDETVRDNTLQWLKQTMGREPLYATHHLGAQAPKNAVGEQICGLLALRVLETKDDFILWYREEVTQTVAWAGKPEKVKIIENGESRLHPRASFAMWKEQVRGLSSPWLAAEKEVVGYFRQHLVQIDLARQIIRERRAREQVETEKHRFRLLSEVSDALVTSLATATTFPRVLERLCRAFCGCAIYIGVEGDLPQPKATVARGLSSLIEAWKAEFFRGQKYSLPSNSDALVPPAQSFVPGHILRAAVRARGALRGWLYLAREIDQPPYEAADKQFLEQVVLRMQTAAENDALYQESQQATAARDQILGVVSHDLRNPLAAMLLTSQVMKRRAVQHFERVDAPWLIKSLGKIEAAGARMERLIEDLLAVSKIEAGHFGLEAAPTDVTQLLQGAFELLEPLATAKRICLEAAPLSAPLTVVADTARIHQVLSNLVGNALKFTPAGGKITLGAVASNRGPTLYVQDTGQGIAPDVLPRIFERFWQAEPAAKHGAGLGLAITRGIVDAHGGKVWAESQIGQGSTFYVRLPEAALAQKLIL